MRSHPHLYEINTWPWLERLSRRHGRVVTLGTVPDEHWDLLARRGFDLVYLLLPCQYTERIYSIDGKRGVSPAVPPYVVCYFACPLLCLFFDSWPSSKAGIGDGVPDLAQRTEGKKGLPVGAIVKDRRTLSRHEQICRRSMAFGISARC